MFPSVYMIDGGFSNFHKHIRYYGYNWFYIHNRKYPEILLFFPLKPKQFGLHKKKGFTFAER